MIYVWLVLNVLCSDTRNCVSYVSMSYNTEKECMKSNEQFNVKCERRQVRYYKENKK